MLHKDTWFTVQPQAVVQLRKVGCPLMSSFHLPILRSSQTLLPLNITSHLMSPRLKSPGWSSVSHHSLSESSSNTNASLRWRERKLFLSYQQSDQLPTCPAGKWQSPLSTLTTQMEKTTVPNTQRNLQVGVSQPHQNHPSE